MARIEGESGYVWRGVAVRRVLELRDVIGRPLGPGAERDRARARLQRVQQRLQRFSLWDLDESSPEDFGIF